MRILRLLRHAWRLFRRDDGHALLGGFALAGFCLQGLVSGYLPLAVLTAFVLAFTLAGGFLLRAGQILLPARLRRAAACPGGRRLSRTSR